jgi:hypothetical protein
VSGKNALDVSRKQRRHAKGYNQALGKHRLGMDKEQRERVTRKKRI